MTLATIEAAAIERQVRVAADERPRLARHVLRHHVAVDEHGVGRLGEAEHRAAHGGSVACRMLRRSIAATEEKAKAISAVLAELGEELPRAAAAVSILESAMPFGIFFGVEHDGGRDHRPGERPAPGFVDAGDADETLAKELPLGAEARADAGRAFFGSTNSASAMAPDRRAARCAIATARNARP